MASVPEQRPIASTGSTGTGTGGAARRARHSAAGGHVRATATDGSAASAHSRVSTRVSARASQKVAAVQAAITAQAAPPRTAFAATFDSAREGWSHNRAWGLKLVSSEIFDIAIGIAIAVNGVVIGVEMDWKSSSNEDVFAFLEVIFLALFTLELSIKVYVFRCTYFMLLIHWLDTLVVLSGFLAVGLRLLSSMQSTKQSAARQLQLFKFARLLRLVRLIRISTQFRPLWLLVRGLGQCVYPLVATMTLLFVNCYVFAALAVDQVSSDPGLQGIHFGRLGHTVGERFASMPMALLSLLHFFAINEVGGEAFDIAQQQPLAIVYVGAFIFIVVVALLNLFTGVLAENANSVGETDEELARVVRLAEWEQVCEELQDRLEEADPQRRTLVQRTTTTTMTASQSLSVRAARGARTWGASLFWSPTGSATSNSSSEDADGSDFKLSMDELFTLCSQDHMRERLNLLFSEEEGSDGGLKRLSEFWHLLDCDGDGLLSLREFVESLASLSKVVQQDLNKSHLWLQLFREFERTKQAYPVNWDVVRPVLMDTGLTTEQVREERRIQELELEEQQRLQAQILDLVQRVQLLVGAQLQTESKLTAIERALKGKVVRRGHRATSALPRARPAQRGNQQASAARRASSR